ncbi:uncharacterized protein MKK02DRAFT_39484 [Dioszegia hungarica]|uniref:Uncharacterized protein n=1 Tax=Dioszegia hungarica TaxID=4972 RepID=A0AA38LXY6_9TREE|nr:uncharacterized protein MKK02DRAFT_39484 [Dioszegia hungarica]KAI9639193.1 hypothetical protein MKK02DRAFT_39484 [Dioszegia hungarica]
MAPGSKTDRFALTQTMRVEHPELGWEPTYTMLARGEGKKWRKERGEMWARYGAMGEEKREFRVRDYGRERKLLPLVTRKLDIAESSSAFMPALRSVAFAPHLHYPAIDPRKGSSLGVLLSYFQAAGDVRQICVRGLRVARSTTESANRPIIAKLVTPPMTTWHFHASEVPGVTLRADAHTRWVYDGPAGADWTTILHALCYRIHVLSRQIGRAPIGTFSPFQLSISCSTGIYTALAPDVEHTMPLIREALASNVPITPSAVARSVTLGEQVEMAKVLRTIRGRSSNTMEHRRVA